MVSRHSHTGPWQPLLSERSVMSEVTYETADARRNFSLIVAFPRYFHLSRIISLRDYRISLTRTHTHTHTWGAVSMYVRGQKCFGKRIDCVKVDTGNAYICVEVQFLSPSFHLLINFHENRFFSGFFFRLINAAIWRWAAALSRFPYRLEANRSPLTPWTYIVEFISKTVSL